MELRHLRYFTMLAEELSFTRAAKRLDIAQPVLSRQIQDLESEIGVRLFDRNSNRVFLTDAGSRFLSEARATLQHASQAVDAARQVQAGAAGTLRLGIAKGLGDVVSRTINGFLRICPGVEMDVKDVPSGFQSKAFNDHRIDVGFMRPPVDNPQLTSKLLFRERFLAVLRKASPLARCKRLQLKDLAAESILLIDRPISPGVYDKMLDLYRSAGMTGKIIQTETMPYAEAGAILIESGKGVYLTVGDNPYHPAFADRLIALPLCDPSAVMPVHIVWRKDEPAKTTLEFVKYALGVFGENRELELVKHGFNRASRRKTKPGGEPPQSTDDYTLRASRR
jgi:DNA-binding transcriptional LysR family regulator